MVGCWMGIGITVPNGLGGHPVCSMIVQKIIVWPLVACVVNEDAFLNDSIREYGPGDDRQDHFPGCSGLLRWI